MKKYSSLRKGFTLVELMIVIAIIGILAAVLYPSLTGYLEKTRDASRSKALANIQLALGTYQAEEGTYPRINSQGQVVTGTTNPVTTACSNDLQQALKSHITAIPTDPSKNFGMSAGSLNCSSKGGYVYKLLGTDAAAQTQWAAYALGARLENKAKANILAKDFNDSNNVTDMNAKISWTETFGNQNTNFPHYAIVN